MQRLVQARCYLNGDTLHVTILVVSDVQFWCE